MNSIRLQEDEVSLQALAFDKIRTEFMQLFLPLGITSHFGALTQLKCEVIFDKWYNSLSTFRFATGTARPCVRMSLTYFFLRKDC